MTPIETRDVDALAAVATSTDPTFLAAAAAGPDVRVRCLVAGNALTPPEVLEVLATDGAAAVRAKVAGQPATPSAALPGLLRDPARQVRRRAIRRDDVTVAMLLDALDSPVGPSAWARLEQQAATDPETVRALIDDGRPAALHVAAGGAVDDDSATRLASMEDQFWLVHRLAHNPVTPIAVLRRLADDERVTPIVAQRLATDSASRRWALRKGATSVLVAMAERDEVTTTQLLAIRMRSRAVNVTRALAAQPRAPTWLVHRLSHHRRWDVRAAAASNPTLRTRRLTKLATSDDVWSVSAAAVRSGRLDANALYLAAHGHPAVQLLVAAQPNISPATAEHLIGHQASPYVRAVVLRNPQLPVGYIQRAARDLTLPAWMLRSVALNPACPPATSEQLLTWLAIGGASTTDATFDPITEQGHPGLFDISEPREAALLRMAAGPGALRHPLSSVRHRYFDHHRTLDEEPLMLLARDAHPAVRRRAVGFTLERSLRELRDDEVPWVASTARSVLTDPSNKLVKPQRVRRALGAPGVIGLLIATSIGFRLVVRVDDTGSNSRPAPVLFPPAASQLVCELPGGGRLRAQPGAGDTWRFKMSSGERAWTVLAMSANGRNVLDGSPSAPSMAPAAPFHVPAGRSQTVLVATDAPADIHIAGRLDDGLSTTTFEVDLTSLGTATGWCP